MDRYRIHIVNADSQIIRSIDLNCQGDQSAIAVALRQEADGHDLELWKGDQKLLTSFKIREIE